LLSKRSLRQRFIFELAIAMIAMLLLVLLALYTYFHSSVMSNLKDEILTQAKDITDQEYTENELSFLKKVSPYQIEILLNHNNKNIPSEFIPSTTENKHFLLLKQSYNNNEMVLEIKRDYSKEYEYIKTMMLISLLIFILGSIFIVFYATLVSKKIMEPLQILTHQFTDMHESLLHQIETKNLPIEFVKLGDSVNLLVTKVSTSIKYRKELYIGTAHELKTPLAVMRLKNQITLMKYKKHDKVREALEQNITSIDTLNAMIHNLLEFGRAEGAQFEQPQRLNLIRLMASKCEEYELLAHSQNRDFIYHFDIPHFRINVQQLLFMQIFQNFIQNALKFTPEHGLVSLDTRMDTDNFIIEITDEGQGLDSDKDLFAPFQRSLESTGAGLGLFLAKNAAESMGVTIDLKNREDTTGAIASIAFPLNRFLLKD